MSDKQDERLMELLARAIKAQKEQWMVMALIESHISNNNGFSVFQSQMAYEVIRSLASAEDGDKVTNEQVEEFIREVAKASLIMRRSTVDVTPMDYEEFVHKYSDAYASAGDEVPGDLTTAYAVYCRDPGGHFLHKDKP